jgi:hypothetical protein
LLYASEEFNKEFKREVLLSRKDGKLGEEAEWAIL